MSSMPTGRSSYVPVLTVLSDGATRYASRAATRRGRCRRPNGEQRAESLASGQLRADNRIGWAASYLNRVDALHRPSRGQYEITEFGRELLERHPDRHHGDAI